MTKKQVIWKFLPEKNRNFSSICLEKLKLFVNLPGKLKFRIFLPGSRTLQISNQTDVAGE